jgi:hypothetical protein
MFTIVIFSERESTMSTNGNHRDQLESKIADSMAELHQLCQRATLDDFQDFWRKKLERRLLDLRQELRDLETGLESPIKPLPAAT